MLIHEIVDYCDREYNNANPQCQCKDCNHPFECSGNCKNCLEQVHYPYRYPDGKHDYDCQNMLNFYVCDYINKYASEMLYLLRKSEKLQEIDEYHILSIGCGAAPDFMAFEQYVLETDEEKEIKYFGIDKNDLWNDIHHEIREYFSNIITHSNFEYEDVMEYFKSNAIKSTNVIVFQYVISHFYNTNQIQYIQDFFMNIVDKVVEKKSPHEPIVILINDTNSCYRGRSFFMDLKDILQNNGYHGTYKSFYFDHNIQNPAQRYGEKHVCKQCLFDLSDFDLRQYEPWSKCSAAQLLIEIE